MEKEENTKINESIISRKRNENEDLSNIIIKKTKCDNINENLTNHTILSEDKKNSEILYTGMEEKKINNYDYNKDISIENTKQNIDIHEKIEISIKESSNETVNNSNINVKKSEQNNSPTIIKSTKKENIIIKEINNKIEKKQNQNETEIENTNQCIEIEKRQNPNEAEIENTNPSIEIEKKQNQNETEIENTNPSIEIAKKQNQNETEIENTNPNTEIENVESNYQYPVYEFKMENTLNSTNPFFNPRCSTQNDFNYNPNINNFFKNAKW